MTKNMQKKVGAATDLPSRHLLLFCPIICRKNIIEYYSKMRSYAGMEPNQLLEINQ